MGTDGEIERERWHEMTWDGMGWDEMRWEMRDWKEGKKEIEKEGGRECLYRKKIEEMFSLGFVWEGTNCENFGVVWSPRSLILGLWDYWDIGGDRAATFSFLRVSENSQKQNNLKPPNLRILRDNSPQTFWEILRIYFWEKFSKTLRSAERGILRFFFWENWGGEGRRSFVERLFLEFPWRK